jgi:hypothetical protein
MQNISKPELPQKESKGKRRMERARENEEYKERPGSFHMPYPLAVFYFLPISRWLPSPHMNHT